MHARIKTSLFSISNLLKFVVLLLLCLMIKIPSAHAVKQYTITASAGTNGSISPSGSVSVPSGSSQTFTMTPNTGYHVANVTVDGVSQGAITSYTFSNITANHTISATFSINTYTITATAGSGGTITPSTANVNYGGSQTFTIAPNTGYHVANVTVDSVSQGAITSYTFSNVTANHTISATFAINTYTITATAGSGGTVTPATATVNYGGSQTFNITPNAGYSVAGVTVDGVSQGAITSYTFTSVAANHTISATFAINTFTITTTAGSGGTITPATSTVNYGGSQTFTINPSAGYSISNVTIDGVSQGAMSSYTFSNVTADHLIAATFAINTYTITATAGSGGTITPGAATVNYGGNQTYTITPIEGYSITDVTVDCISQGAIGSYTFTNVTAAHIIAATFAVNTYTINASAGSGGGISPSGTVSVNYGANQSFTIMPNTGYSVTDVSVDGVSQGIITSYTFSNVTDNHTIAATFAINLNPITLTIDSPTAGATINRPDIMVTGTVTNAGDYETGVTVNGVVAIVYGNQFVANHVPLRDGPNTITVTAIDIHGAASTSTVTVTAATTGNYIRLTSDTESGIAPLVANLRIDGSFPITASTLSATGPVQPEFISSTADQYRVKMNVQGIYFFTASTTGPDNNLYQDTVAILVTDVTQMDALLKGKWGSMKMALMANDIDGAMSNFGDFSKDKYRRVFLDLGPDLPAIINSLPDIVLVSLDSNVAEYAINRLEDGVNRLYFIYFIRDENGLWKIDAF